MLLSIAYIFLLSLCMGWFCKRLKLPSFIGMLLTGMLLGPYALQLIDISILDMSSDLRNIALIIILLRAGLSLQLQDLKKVGKPAILMCFIPACFELIAMVLFAPVLLGISLLDAAIMGTVIAAVSPAVIVPKMLTLMKEGYGTKKSIPQLILAGASVDDVFVIVLFGVFTGFAQGSSLSLGSLFNIPITILLGIGIGGILGYLMVIFFIRFHLRDTAKVIILLSISFILVSLEPLLSGILPFSSLIAIMVVGMLIQHKKSELSIRLSSKFNKLWVGAEIILFVLVGATVDMSYVVSSGFYMIILLVLVLVFRMLGVYVCLLKTNLLQKERLFCMIAYIPKATVQAAIGGVPLALGLSSGSLILTMAVIAILITAPVGALFIDCFYKKLLEKEETHS